jgi:hypothetical protein
LEGGIEWGTQQENSYTKYAVMNRIPLAATLGRMNEASHQNLLTKVLGRTNYVADVSSEGNERHQLLIIKTDKVSKLTGRLENAIHDVHKYIIG